LIFLLVSALAILVLCVAVYTQAQSARLDRTRSFADERIQLAAQSYDTNDVLEGKRATFKTGSPHAKMWAAVAVKDGKILSIEQDYETSDDSMKALQR